MERIVERLILPQAVWEELTAAPSRPGAEAISEAPWIEVRSVRQTPANLLALLDRGEAEVIALAEELEADEVLIDERAARAIAITRGLRVIGAAGLLVRAKDRHLVPAVRPLLTRMQEAGVWYSQSFFESLMEQLGEP